MRLPPALVPLRNATFRNLWLASVVAWLGTWLQNTGAGWLMTTLAPQPLIVAMVQAATIMPVFLLALPGGALADIIDRRLFLIGTQIWTISAATLLAVLTLSGSMTAGWLLVLTFAIGIGSALTAPAWSAVVPELVPREDLVQAIAMNGIGYNLTRAIGPAIGGFLILIGGSSLAFSLYAVSILSVIAALVMWRRGSRRFTGLPREHLLSAMRAGMRFVRNTPAVQAAMARTIAYSIPASAPWALLPLFARQDLNLGAGMYGMILGMMGIGGVTSGMLLPMVRGRISRGATVLGCSLFSCTGMALIGLTHHWAVASLGMLLFGVGWTSAYATIQAAAQLACPSWVRARSLAIYQLAQNGALTIGSFFWGWVAGRIGLSDTFLAAAAVGVVLMLIARRFRIEAIVARPVVASDEPILARPTPEAPAAELAPRLRHGRGRVMETVHYRVDSSQRSVFLALMLEIRHVRGRSGALFWQLYEDVAHPEGWMEVWSMESWADHMRESVRLSEDDKRVLDRAAVFQAGAERPARYLSVDPHESVPQLPRAIHEHPRLAAPRPAAGPLGA